jgi:hypothetical protein
MFIWCSLRANLWILVYTHIYQMQSLLGGTRESNFSHEDCWHWFGAPDRSSLQCRQERTTMCGIQSENYTRRGYRSILQGSATHSHRIGALLCCCLLFCIWQPHMLVSSLFKQKPAGQSSDTGIWSFLKVQAISSVSLSLSLSLSLSKLHPTTLNPISSTSMYWVELNRYSSKSHPNFQYSNHGWSIKSSFSFYQLPPPPFSLNSSVLFFVNFVL